MAHYDAELEAVDAARVERSLEGDAAARGLVTELAELGELVREVERDREYPDVAPAVLAVIEREGTPALAREARAVVSSSSATRRGALGAVCGALALAAAAYLSFGLTVPSSPVPVASSPVREPVAARVTETAALAPALPAPPVSVEHVDFGSQSGSIFVLDPDKRSTLVVWVVDPAESTTRIRPL
jgi:hypothetical protein